MLAAKGIDIWHRLVLVLAAASLHVEQGCRELARLSGRQLAAWRIARVRSSFTLPPRWSHYAIPAVVLTVGVSLSFAVSRWAGAEMSRSAQSRFDTAANNATVQVERRFAAYVEVLEGLRALFHTRDVSREDFRRYTESLDLGHQFPGFKLLNYAPYVVPAAKEAFVQAQQHEADPRLRDFTITPPGQRDGYQPLTLVEPLAGNEQALGKDIAASPPVRESLEAARDSGKLSASGKPILSRVRGGGVGLAVRLPVYRPGMPIDTVEQRRAAYQGSVGAGFLVADMLAGLPGLDRHIRLQLFDGGLERGESKLQPIPEPKTTALFDTAHAAAASHEGPSKGLQRVQSFTLGGRIWVVKTSAANTEESSSLERMVPSIILMGGCVISALLAGVLFSLMGARRRATSLALSMTRSLRISEQRLAEAQALARLGSWVLDTRTGVVECSDEARRIYGLGEGMANPALTQLLILMPAEQRVTLLGAITRTEQLGEQVEVEHALLAQDGTQRWVHVTLRKSAKDGASSISATVRDDTSRRKAAIRLELAHAIARELAAQGEPQRAADYILASIGTQMGWHAALCWRVGDDGRMDCTQSWLAGSQPALQRFAADMHGWNGPGTLPDAAWSAGNPLWRAIPAAQAPGTRDEAAGRAGLRTALIIPLLAGSQRVAIEFFNREPMGVDRETEAFMRSVGSQWAQYLQRKQAEEALLHVANHDALTGLASRPLLHERLLHAIQRATRQQTRVAVLFMDLDRFKQVNDSLGHSCGDLLLQGCAQRLRECVRSNDTVARFGGDEFVVILEDLKAASDAVAPLTKLQLRFGEPFDVEGRELRASVSIGVSTFPDDGHDAETLLMHADAAMYRAKEKGAGTYEFYAAPMNSHGSYRLTLESSLHRAIEREELFLVYQPKLDLATATICGVEALMRWRHPTMGLISPAQFIPIAEESGLIDSMGQWALEVACRDAKRWQDEGHAVQVSVNLSARQLDRPKLAEEVEATLRRAGLAPGQLELEITESGVMRDPALAAAQLNELRQRGVSLAIDDFGTGYSSLSYLRRFPFCTLKIDRSFVKDLPGNEDAATLTAGIIALAQRLRMQVVAEGVETPEQLAYLRVNHCDLIQGYFVSKPISADEMGRLLARDVRHLVSPLAAA